VHCQILGRDQSQHSVIEAVACGSAALFNALAGHFGDRDGSALACIPVALTVYAVVSASARRAVPVIVGAAVAAMEAGAASSGRSRWRRSRATTWLTTAATC
jgi:uncharacterized Ntn-hydrolase superfamily protein